MRFLRVLFLAAPATVALALCASSASATVLCKTNTTPCASQVTAGSKVEMSLTGLSVLKAGFATVECTASEIVGTIENAGGSSSTVSGKVESLSFSSCNCPVTTLKSGSVEAHHISGSMNGTVTSTGAEVSALCSGVSCAYATGAGTSLGTLTAGEPAKLDVSASLPKSSGGFLCAATASWTATYEVKTPTPLYVAESAATAQETTLTTSLSGESKSGEAITVLEGSKVKDTATLSGNNASKATGTVKYKVYADAECKELVTSAGEATVSEGKVPTSEEKTLEAGRIYYWQAEYSGDSNNLKSTSTCGKEVLTVKAATSLSTTLFAEEAEEPIEGKEITVFEPTLVKGRGTLSGTNSSTATGTVEYSVYADAECEELATEAGEGGVEAGEAGFSDEVELEEGTYYWQAEYSGDALHQASKSVCGLAVAVVAVRMFRTNVKPVAALIGTQLEAQVFDFAGNQVKCTEAKYVGSISNLSTAILMLDPTYSKCTGLGNFTTQEVKPEGCEWKLQARIAVNPSKGIYKDKTFLTCSGGKNLKALAYDNAGVIQCEVRVTGGQEATYFEFENQQEGTGRLWIRVVPNLGNLAYEVTKKEAGCNLPAMGAHAGGKLTGKFKLEIEGAGNLLIS